MTARAQPSDALRTAAVPAQPAPVHDVLASGADGGTEALPAARRTTDETAHGTVVTEVPEAFGGARQAPRTHLPQDYVLITPRPALSRRVRPARGSAVQAAGGWGLALVLGALLWVLVLGGVVRAFG